MAGCRESHLQSCTNLYDAKRYAEAAKRCEQVYATEGNAKAGDTAAHAHYRLNHDAEVLAWVDRLADTADGGLYGLAAAVYQRRGEVALAEKAHRRALALYRAAGDHQQAAATLYRMFYLCWEASRYREAFEFAIQTLEEAERAGDRKSQLLAAQGLRSVLDAVGDFEGVRRALEMEGRLIDPGDRAARARIYANRGLLLLDGGRYALARRDLERALETAAGERDRFFFRAVHLNLVELNLSLGNLDQALEHLEKAWQYVEPDGPTETSLLYYRARVDLARGRAAEAELNLTKALSEEPIPDWAWDLEYQLGRTKEALGDPRLAEKAYERSAGIVEEMRRSLAFDDLKSSLLDRKRKPFEALFLLQARAGRGKDALETAERVQARTFLDVFLNAAPLPRAGGADAWSVDRTVHRLKALESLLPAMNRSSVASLRSLDRVQERFGERHALVYIEAGDEVWLILVHGRRISLRQLGASQTEIAELVGSYLARPDDTATADRLGQVLLPPGSLPPSGTMVHIAADGALGNLPFAAIRRGGRFLVEDHAVVLVPSLNALVAVEEQARDGYGAAVTLADPHGDLTAAAKEAAEVASSLGTAARISGRATFAELKQASRARVLHLATHTGLGPRGPWLRLADRDVTAAEIVTGRIGPRLVVLASCASAVRTRRQMWGSLSAAFLAAGSQAVLASLWSIEDERAREFVLRFYTAGGLADPAEALARAQRVAIGKGESPRYWAPFVLQGSSGPFNDVQGDRHAVAMAGHGGPFRSRIR